MLHNGSLLGLTSLFGVPLCVHFIMLCARITHYPSLDLDTAKDFLISLGSNFMILFSSRFIQNAWPYQEDQRTRPGPVSLGELFPKSKFIVTIHKLSSLIHKNYKRIVVLVVNVYT